MVKFQDYVSLRKKIGELFTQNEFVEAAKLLAFGITEVIETFLKGEN